MDLTDTIVRYVDVVLFAALGIASLRAYRRRPARPALWASIAFGTIGIVVVIAAVFPENPPKTLAYEVFLRVVLVALLAFPYALYRFSAAFEPLPRRLDDVAAGLTVGVMLATVFAPTFPREGEPRPLWTSVYVLALIAQWGTLSAVCGARLWRAGRGQAAVSRLRMRTLALGAIGLALSILPGVMAPEDQPAGVHLASLLLPPVCAVLFVLGVSPPPWLRMFWRRADSATLRAVELSLIGADGREAILATALPHVAALVGGGTATVVVDADIANVMRSMGDDDGLDPSDVLRIPLTRGVLVIETGPYSPFFGQDEIEMLHSFAAFLDLVLERTSLLEMERDSRLEAERVNAELETLVYGISHDLKSPVISLLGYLEYLKEDLEAVLTDDTRHFLARMESSATYMQDLLADLLELSRIGRVSVDPEEVDLTSVLADIAGGMATAFPDARVDVEPLPLLFMNGARARQLFTNLVENAARHGGRDDVTIKVRGLVRDDGHAVLSVIDDGVGIPAAYREKAFGIFERLAGRETGGGTGIGLALCRKIVENAGGTIGIADTPSGTHVRIELPPHVVRRTGRPTFEVV